MTCIHPTTVTLSLLSLLVLSSAPVGRGQDRTGGDNSQKTYTITGSASLAGVTMKGLPGDPVTDDNGIYAVRVAPGWSGKVTPMKRGYAFTPPFRDYAKVNADFQNHDFAARILTFTISGNAGMGGVLMKGLPGNPVTDAKGAYTARVEYGWSGKIMPEKEGYQFEPVSKSFQPVTADVARADFTAQVRMLTISNTLKAGNEPIVGVTVKAEPGGYTAETDSQGRYTIKVPYGWTGRLIPNVEEGPDSLGSFTNVTSDILDGTPVPSGRRPGSPSSQTPMRPRVALPGAVGNVVVIPTKAVAPQEFAETAEDLRVMLDILREKLSEPRMVRGAFVDFGPFFEDRNRTLAAFYLQGSAAVFVLEIDSPFSFAPQPPAPRQAEPEPVDPVWQRARQRLATPQDPMLRSSRGGPDGTGNVDFPQFKEDLLRTLRHAANLRHVEPNEAVVLTIIAHENSGGWPRGASTGGSFSSQGGTWFEGGSSSTSSGTFGPGGGTTQADSQTYSRGSAASPGRVNRGTSGSAPAAPTTVLSLQAKKAEIDAFAKGTLSFEQFQQRAKAFTY